MNKTVLKECKYHGLTEHKVEKRGYARCKKCASEAVTLKRRRVKLTAVDYLGGKCCICGYDKCVDALEFHHKDPTQKDFGISTNGACRSWNKIKQELDKCILLCANCHREVHDSNKRVIISKNSTKYDDYIDKIVELKKLGKSTYYISSELKISRNTVMKYIKQFNNAQ